MLHVALTKPDTSVSFGFGIMRDNSTFPSLLKVAQITPGGIADIDGRLNVGNRLLQVHLCCHYIQLVFHFVVLMFEFLLITLDFCTMQCLICCY